MIVVTTETIPGKQIYCVIGEVIGITARGANPFTEGLKHLNGVSKPAMPSLIRWRRDAINEMISEATKLGADAIIGMKFDTRQITTSWSEICAYGTAVRLSDPVRTRPTAVGRASHHLHHEPTKPRHGVREDA
jgi:uncharacterized protein YbjQ (UPF0145 family)